MAKNRPFLSCLLNVIFIPNRTFLVCFGGVLGDFGLAMARILARRSQATIPMAKPKEPDMSPKRTKKVRLGIYIPYPNSAQVNMMSWDIRSVT